MSYSSLSAPPTTGTLSPDEIRLRLQRMLPSLAEFGSREEAQFVAIGQKLGDFLQRFRTMSRYCDEVIDSLGRQEGDEIRTALHGTVLGDVRRLQDYSAAIADALNEIITAVQFHDITRQQVEHVQIALHDFCARLAGDDSVEHLAAQATELCRIQAAQLRHTRHDLVAAVARMIASLRSIAPVVQQLAQETRLLATQGGVQLMEKLDHDALTLAADVVTAADKITIHDEARKIIDRLVAELEFLAGSDADDAGTVGEAKILDLLSQNYTMQSERRVHAKVRQSDAAVAEPAEEDRTGLGGNVELF